ncbi:hypothetical protein [Streptomyces smyrnaeus]|uniref:hypothetical protein n=1 Tax=Streptomyces smyrnaeus TaxID=1387713 RepID=UPI00368B546F
MFAFIRRYSTRLYAVAAAALALVAHYVHDLPQGLILAVVAAVLGYGVDRVTVSKDDHNQAVREALNTPVPEQD